MTLHRAEAGPVVTVGERPLRLDEVVAVAHGRARVCLSASDDVRRRLDRSVSVLRSGLEAGRTVYGVNTGFGDSCNTAVPTELLRDLPGSLARYHGCGVGPALDEAEARAVVVSRVASLVWGHSAVRPLVLERLLDLVNAGFVPFIPELGSVGASGDLTPLSYVAAVLMGERDTLRDGDRVPARVALSEIGAEPLVFGPKETLALMNGTSMMTGVAILAYDRTRRLARAAAALSAMATEVTESTVGHLDARIFEAKPHPGQATVARWMREDLTESERLGRADRLQARYSLRCAPHVIGVTADVLPLAGTLLATELNGANDNPLVDVESGEFLHGGNFYGGHVCMIADTLKTQVASIADLLDRQLALITSAATSHGLPDGLVVPGETAAARHGFKAMQITASALAAEALKLTMPASSFSRSTENHNQDKVSMGSIAARDWRRTLDLTEAIVATLLLALCQAVDLRGSGGMGRRSRALWTAVRARIPTVQEDRAMDADIAMIVSMMSLHGLDFGEASGC